MASGGSACFLRVMLGCPSVTPRVRGLPPPQRQVRLTRKLVPHFRSLSDLEFEPGTGRIGLLNAELELVRMNCKVWPPLRAGLAPPDMGTVAQQDWVCPALRAGPGAGCAGL